jgi:hypothetical protein
LTILPHNKTNRSHIELILTLKTLKPNKFVEIIIKINYRFRKLKWTQKCISYGLSRIQ